MNYEPMYTTKKSHAIAERSFPPPVRPRKCNFISSTSSGAHSVSFINSESYLSPLYDRKSEISYLEQCFHLLSCIGEGSFAIVYKVVSVEDGKLYAVKKSKERFLNSRDRDRKLKEVEKQEKLSKHPNCVQLYHAWEEDGHLFLQIELCESSLAKYTKTNHLIAEEMLWNILTDISLALKHLHDRNVMHLDIKLDNILIATDGTFKLGDFGIAVDCSQMLNDVHEGDAKYVAPELLGEHFTKSADIFSLGISMLELSLDLNLPQRGVLWHQLRHGIFPPIPIPRESNELIEVAKWMMQPEPEKRPTIDMILKHGRVRKILAKRKSIINILTELGKLMKSLLTFFGKFGYDVIMAAILRLCQINQETSALTMPANIRNDNEQGSAITTLITSTPVTARTFEFYSGSSSRISESWEINRRFDDSMEFDGQDEHENTSVNLCQVKMSTCFNCTCHRRLRSHPYNDKFYSKTCDICGGKKSSIVRNLMNEFSQYDGKEY